MLRPLYQSALDCLMQSDPTKKVAMTRALYADWRSKELALDTETKVERIQRPGRPEAPELVSPRKVPKRSFESGIGRLRMAHAIAHIEFNAINLALDAVYRFRDMPAQYYGDWLQVASEEALHFSLLNDYLQSQHSHYGAYTAHNGLWEMALKTDHDVLTRMALVPRVLEARGLDVTQSMIARLEQVGDDALAAILRIIYSDEIGHVGIGSHWFKYLCGLQNRDSDETFSNLLTEYQQAKLTGPMDELARTQAGFTRNELNFLSGTDNG
jgi:uncharacterized ferritin-like protein (DUF455 family)